MKNKRSLETKSDGDRLRYPSIPPLIVWILCPLLLGGCATWPEPTHSVHVGHSSTIGRCADFFASLDARTAASQTFDAGYTRVKQYPYLRTDRFTASFRNEVEDEDSFSAWIGRMQALDRSARQAEIANLSDADWAAADIAFIESPHGREDLTRKITACGDLLKAVDFSSAANRQKLRRNVFAKDEYIPLRRVLGLSPITNLFVSRGVKTWHAQARERFSSKPPTDWRTIRYVPKEKKDARAAHGIIRRIVQQAPSDALGIPSYTAEDRQTLFRRFAPIWVLQIQSDEDRIGAPIWRKDGRIHVNTDRPITYTHLSFTRFDSEILTQLNYIIWLPSRPKEGIVDIYAGRLDGLNYRITLDEKGVPIIYETVHNCGCYYQAYPTDRLKVRSAIAYAEPPLILQAPEINPATTLMAVAMEGRTHYVRHVYPQSRSFQSQAIAYDLADYAKLKRLDQGDGSPKSMFDRYGLVPGTERLERFILWPTGVLSPGAMRQWGKHAVAFVGRRHFDDPFYLDNMFTPTE